MRVRCSTTSVSPWVNAAMGAAIGVSILAGGTLVGCGGDEPLSLGNAEVGLTADVADEAPDPVDLEPKTPSPEDIARQIERDREIIAAREAQRNRDHELRRPVGAPVVDRAIQWGSPDRTATNVNDDNERDWRDRPFTRTPATPLPSNTRTLEPADPNAIMDDIAGDTIDGDDPDGDNGERNATQARPPAAATPCVTRSSVFETNSREQRSDATTRCVKCSPSPRRRSSTLMLNFPKSPSAN